MKTLISTVLTLACMTAGAVAASSADEDLVKRRDERLKAAWLKKADWLTDYDQALAEARKTGKPIFAYFTTPSG